MRVLETATLQHHRSMNPCPLYDEFTGTLFLFFITVLGRTPEAYQIVTGQNVTRLCCVTSADQGLSWSTAMDLTQQVIGTAIKGSPLERGKEEGTTSSKRVTMGLGLLEPSLLWLEVASG